MEMIIGILAVFAVIALIAATSVYKERESWVAFYVFGGLAVAFSLLHFVFKVL